MPNAKPARGIDCHAHVFTATAPAIPGARYRPAYEATLDAWMAEWRRVDVTHGVLVQPSFFGTDNREMLAAIARAPQRLRGVAVVDDAIDEGELARLDAARVRAIRLNLAGVADYAAFANASWTRLFERVAKLGWHVETHVDAGRAPEIAAALSKSRVDVVFDHFANPAASLGAETTFEAASRLARDRAVWVKLSGAYRLAGHDPVELARRWIDVLGADRIVWGSDWPWTRHEGANDYGRLRGELDRWIGPDRVRAALWDNPARLYGFD